jgi:hypothetical protein
MAWRSRPFENAVLIAASLETEARAQFELTKIGADQDTVWRRQLNWRTPRGPKLGIQTSFLSCTEIPKLVIALDPPHFKGPAHSAFPAILRLRARPLKRSLSKQARRPFLLWS